MTVKRRLLLFSVLMIAVLLVVGNSLLYLGKSALFKHPERRDDRPTMSPGAFWVMRDEVSGMAAAWEDGRAIEAIARETEALREKLLGAGAELALFSQGQRLVGEAGSHADVVVPARMQEYTLTSDHGTLYVRRVGQVELRLTTNQLVLRLRRDQETVFYTYMFASVGTLVLATILINFVFSRFIFRRIEGSITTLSSGVGEVRDGNLGYRIRYPHADEFAELCTAFNEMASQLEASEAKRQRDEQSRKELIAGISHDLRTPLTSIKAYAEGLESELGHDPEKRRKYLATIRSKAHDLEKMISQLLLFSKLDTGTFPLQLESFDLRQEMQTLLDQMEPVYSVKGLQVSLEEGDKAQGLRVRADRTQLKNAVLNIVENSLKYKCAAEGCLCLRCEGGEASARLVLTDNGPGVPESELERLFEVFYRCDPARSNTGNGSGLGLAITARIMAQLGGGIRAENAPGGGLTITLTFPLAQIAQIAQTNEVHHGQQTHSDH